MLLGLEKTLCRSGLYLVSGRESQQIHGQMAEMQTSSQECSACPVSNRINAKRIAVPAPRFAFLERSESRQERLARGSPSTTESVSGASYVPNRARQKP